MPFLISYNYDTTGWTNKRFQRYMINEFGLDVQVLKNGAPDHEDLRGAIQRTLYRTKGGKIFPSYPPVKDSLRYITPGFDINQLTALIRQDIGLVVRIQPPVTQEQKSLVKRLNIGTLSEKEMISRLTALNSGLKELETVLSRFLRQDSFRPDEGHHAGCLDVSITVSWRLADRDPLSRYGLTDIMAAELTVFKGAGNAYQQDWETFQTIHQLTDHRFGSKAFPPDQPHCYLYHHLYHSGGFSPGDLARLGEAEVSIKTVFRRQQITRSNSFSGPLDDIVREMESV